MKTRLLKLALTLCILSALSVITVFADFTHTAGNKQIFAPTAAKAGVNIGPVSSDPTTLVNGDMWYNTTEGAVKIYAGGVKIKIATVPTTSTGGNGTADAGMTATFDAGGNLRAEQYTADLLVNVGGASIDAVNDNPGVVVNLTRTGTVPSHAVTDVQTLTNYTAGNNSFDARPNVGTGSGTEAFDHYAGLQLRPVLKASSFANPCYGIVFKPEATRGTYPLYYGMLFDVPVLGGTSLIQNWYCLKVGGILNNGRITNAYGIAIEADIKSWSLGSWTFGAATVPNSAAAVEINSTTKGLLLSRMTKAQRNAISATDGLIVYQTDNTPGLRARVNGAWVSFTTSADP